jgi:16S rRNA (cytosine967-C5)-methyltransferase
VKIQRDILNDTLPWLAPDGLLLYSTCSVWPEENESQIGDFLSKNVGLELVEQSSIMPSFDETLPEKYHDGGYLAVIRKRTSA